MLLIFHSQGNTSLTCCCCRAFWRYWRPSDSGRFVSVVFSFVARKNAALLLQENASPEEHVVYVWDHFVSKAQAKDVFIMAHSYGGLSFVELVSRCFSSFPPLMCRSPPTKPHRASLTFTSGRFCAPLNTRQSLVLRVLKVQLVRNSVVRPPPHRRGRRELNMAIWTTVAL